MTNVSTLAHELGHAYHSWVMRKFTRKLQLLVISQSFLDRLLVIAGDMPLSETHYPMNLAETASIFFETVVADALMKQATDPAERFQSGYYECDSAAAFLLNIPSRFDFEVAMHEARAEGTVSS